MAKTAKTKPPGSPHNLEAMRHSLAHVLAMAVLDMFPEAKLGIGPAIDDGFYYDFDLPRTLIPEDLPILEQKMRDLIAQDLPFTGKEVAPKAAVDSLKKIKQPYKVELAEEFAAEKKPITFYQTGTFVDLCAGGHLTSTKQIGAFKLTTIAGAYWRGDEQNKMLQRIYGVAFATESALNQHLERLAAAEQRDHRKLGKQLDLFHFSDLVGSGLPMFTPRGALLRELLNRYSQALRLEQGFDYVWSPHLTKKQLYETSGHWDKFGGELFLVKSQETSDELVMKPMNCPHHQQIYASQPRSYRDLPLRYMETTTIYRDEKAGELLGLARVRSITQDDSHIFCTLEQIPESLNMLIAIVKTFYKTIGMELKVRLSLRDQSDAYLGDTKLWQQAESMLRKVLRDSKLDFDEAEGEAAFYGPKIDFMAVDVLGREWQVATPQLDFVQPKRFQLAYTNQDGSSQTPVMIHFALMGSLERFLAVYIEHTAGAFPLWLAPEQVRLLPIADRHAKTAATGAAELRAAGLRVTVDDRPESVGKKIREAEVAKVPYMLVIGDKEIKAKAVAVRSYHRGDLGTKKVTALVKTLAKEVADKALPAT